MIEDISKKEKITLQTDKNVVKGTTNKINTEKKRPRRRQISKGVEV
jgi:hypothetical protein